MSAMTGGIYTTDVGQKILAAALNSPISVMETAGEGGAWGIALLAAYLVRENAALTLPEWLDDVVFAGNTGTSVDPDPAAVEGFNKYIKSYLAALPVEKAAVEFKA